MLNCDIKKIEIGKPHKIWGEYDGKLDYVTADRIITDPSYMSRVGLENRLKKG
jgi:hypothetical protein